MKLSILTLALIVTVISTVPVIAKDTPATKPAKPETQPAPKTGQDPAATRLTCVNEQRGDIFVGDPVYFSFSVANKGSKTLPAASFSVRLYCEGKIVGGDGSIPKLKPGAGVSYGKMFGTPHFIPTKPGKYTYKVVVIPNTGTGDDDKTNNVIEKTIIVKDNSNP